jgi:sugar/nucleoside kinase (ribokinase family)
LIQRPADAAGGGTMARVTGARVATLGEVLVDFVSEAAHGEPATERRRVPRFGGSRANIAVGAARFGARSAFLGGTGADRYGRWLGGILRAEGVDLAGFRLLEGVKTPSARIMVSPSGEPSFRFHGDREECIAAAAARSRGRWRAGRAFSRPGAAR